MPRPLSPVTLHSKFVSREVRHTAMRGLNEKEVHDPRFRLKFDDLEYRNLVRDTKRGYMRNERYKTKTERE